MDMKNMTALMCAFVRCYHYKNNNIKIYECLNENDMEREFFYDYNTLNPNNKIIAPKGVGYVLAVKK